MLRGHHTVKLQRQPLPGQCDGIASIYEKHTKTKQCRKAQEHMLCTLSYTLTHALFLSFLRRSRCGGDGFLLAAAAAAQLCLSETKKLQLIKIAGEETRRGAAAADFCCCYCCCSTMRFW